MAAKLLKSALAALMAMMLVAGSATAVPEQQADDDTFWLWTAAKNCLSVVTNVLGMEDETVLRPASAHDGTGVDEVDPPHNDACLDTVHDHFCTR
jgi:hypothetical protein